jgi:hypothetical protein
MAVKKKPARKKAAKGSTVRGGRESYSLTPGGKKKKITHTGGGPFKDDYPMMAGHPKPKKVTKKKKATKKKKSGY